ncbi:hydroxypyruvate isomerase family protein [Leisingera caerulea]|uniref:hydroxypyruvate isomerase family protein n=1 Tax=Leisingera caerulea TaxID=506591 RepID=UPI0021A43358|nr:TIM barrel protein [Leisingera caerulea]UWQ86045.1 TIM barrel protein [Leisingera caerulea]
MIRFSAHLGYLFTELPIEQRLEAAARVGFEAVEHPAPFSIPAARMKRLLTDNGLRMTQVTSGMGEPGEKGIASLPGRETEFRDTYAQALDYAEAIDCPFVHAMVGVGGDRVTYLGNLDVAQALCEARSPDLLIEAISEAAVPGYHLCSLDDLLRLGRNRPLHILIDTFHACVSGHDPAEVLRRADSSLGHVHIADHPGRNEPGSGTLDFTDILNTLNDLGYAGAVGFEYLPSGADHLQWMPGWRKQRDGFRKGHP